MTDVPVAGPASRDFLVPDLGEGLEEATVVRWLVGVGDAVALNQPLCVVETAKAEVEVPSPYAGTVVALGGAEGETLRVGTLLARIAPQGAAPPPARQPTLVGYGHDESLDRSRRASRRPAAAASAPPGGSRQRPLASPLVRKLARTRGVDLAALAPGSGPGGVITRRDVEDAAPPTPGGRQAGPSPDRGGDEVITVTGIRARIAERMARSRSSIPDATCSIDIDCTALLRTRATLAAARERRGEPADVTPFTLITRFVVLALRSNRLLNASFVTDVPEVRVHRAIHLGVATATPRGLLVPVVRDAAGMSLGELATEMARLADGARAGTLTPAELQGSTFTISNFGALGLDDGIPVINHPEAAILGVGAIRPRPWVQDGELAVRSVARFTVAFDHRVCDGAEVAAFLRTLRELVEEPAVALLDV